ncbi:hypothetical protein Tco_0438265 [Tanacetum coccineum]
MASMKLTQRLVDSLTLLLHISSLLFHLYVTHGILEIVLHRLIMVNLSFDLNLPKDSSNTDEVAQNGGTLSQSHLKSTMAGALHQHLAGLTLVDRLNVLPFFKIKIRLNGLHTLNVNDDVLEMAKYVKDNKIILVYVEHGSSNVDSSIFVTPKKGVSIAVDNHLRKDLIEIDSSPDSTSSVEGPIVVESADDPFKDLDEILGDYVNTREQVTRDEITGKHMVVHVGVGPIGKFKKVEVDADNKSEEDSNTEENDTTDSDSEDLDYDPNHDEVFDDNEHIVEDVHVSMNNFNFNADPKHNLSIGSVKIQEHNLDVIDYDSFGSDLHAGIDSERRI